MYKTESVSNKSTRELFKKIILLISFNERENLVTPVIQRIEKEFGDKVIVFYRDFDSSRLPEGFDISFKTNLAVGDYVLIGIPNEDHNDDIKEEKKPTLLCIIERKSGNDFLNTDPNHFKRQIRDMDKIEHVKKYVFLTAPPDMRYTNETNVLSGITKQLGMDKGRIPVINTFNENYFGAAMERVIRYYFDGSFKKGGSNKDDMISVDVELLAACKKKVINTPTDALFVFLGSIYGIGSKTADAISKQYKSIENLLEESKKKGVMFLFPLVNKSKSMIIYKCLSESNFDNSVEIKEKKKPAQKKTIKDVKIKEENDEIEKNEPKQEKRKYTPMFLIKRS